MSLYVLLLSLLPRKEVQRKVPGRRDRSARPLAELLLGEIIAVTQPSVLRLLRGVMLVSLVHQSEADR
jgi:hypothetical protein